MGCVLLTGLDATAFVRWCHGGIEVGGRGWCVGVAA